MSDWCKSCGHYRRGYAQLETHCQLCDNRVHCICGLHLTRVNNLLYCGDCQRRWPILVRR